MLKVLKEGPVAAGCSRETLARLAKKLILIRTSASSVASFAMGIPGGLALGATIPADTLQFFGMSLRLAQELTYLYGAQDLWQDGQIDNDNVRGQLLLYCGVMFGISGAANGVRILSSRIAATVLEKLPQKPLMKTLWYPIVKQIGKLIGVKITKNTVAKGISKVIPVVGGVVSGGLNFASMHPMAKRLAIALDQATFDYTEADVIKDYEEVQKMAEEPPTDQGEEKGSAKKRAVKSIKHVGNGISYLLPKGKKSSAPTSGQPDDVFTKIEKLAKLKETGALTQEEYDVKKAELLSQI